MRFSLVLGTTALASVLALSAQSVAAQSQEVQVTLIPEARLDLIANKNTALHAGLGGTVPVSRYVAVGGTLGAGISESGFSMRGDLFARYSLDPYRQYYWEPYVGGGVTTRYDAGGPGTRSYLLGVVGFNGPNAGGIAPGVELGIGGGVRLGITLRWGQPKTAPKPR